MRAKRVRHRTIAKRLSRGFKLLDLEGLSERPVRFRKRVPTSMLTISATWQSLRPYQGESLESSLPRVFGHRRGK